MKQTPATAVGRHLVWLVLQSWVLLPMVVGQLTVESWADSPWAFRLIDSLLFVVVGFFVVRNLVRLWRAPACEASGRTVLSLTLVGVLFTIAATGPLLESDRWSTKPLGVAAALVGAALLTLGVRDAFRMRSLRSRLAAQHEQPPAPT